MTFKKTYPYKSLFFAPMEGITDEPYRRALYRLCPDWDFYSTDFLRIPSEGEYKDEKIIEHYGSSILKNSSLKKKTCYQILTTHKANTESHIKRINELGFHHLDLNLGCPSRKVNSHKGGAYLLSNLNELEGIIKIIRANFTEIFTCKIRIGFRDDQLFEDIIKLLNNEGVEAITIHGRTRDQMYEGKADWSYIKKAVEISKIPIIGNGDIWELEDIDKIFNETNCYAVMLGRGALKTPWMASWYKDWKKGDLRLDETFLLQERKKYLETYFDYLEQEYGSLRDERGLLKRFKAFSRYLFDDFENASEIKSLCLRSMTLKDFKINYQKLS